MQPREILERARHERFGDAKGRPLALELRPGLADAELRGFERQVGAPLPPEVAKLLRFARGFSLGRYTVDFLGGEDFELPEVFPRGVPLAGDGFGNFWVADVHPATGAWGPVFFACHDPPVVILQSPSLGAFVSAVLDTARPGAPDLLDSARDVVFEAWGKDEARTTAAEAAASGDEALARFARALPGEEWRIADLRVFRAGAGFEWGANGPDTAVIRDPGGALLFAVEPPRPRGPGLWKRLFGRR